MSNTINIIAERKGAGPTQIEHPITKELLTGTPVPGTTDQDQVSFDVDIELPTPFTFTAVLGGKRFDFLRDALYPGAFRYDVPEGSKYSSAGVFDGDKLVRLLWGNRPETPGNGKLGKWDGRLDNLQRASGGEYTIRVLTHGLEAKWEGVAGNSSWPATNLGTMQRGYQFLRNIVQATSGKLHYVKHFTEGESFAGYMVPTDLKNRVELFPRWGVGTTTRFNATDGSGVYATRENRNKGNETVMPSWTTGYSDSTGKLLALPNATSYTPDPDHPEQAERAINFLNPGDTSNTPTGLAVQRSGNLLFMPYLGNKVTVAHKTSGAVLGSTAISSVSSGTVDGQDNPWFITADQVAKYTADATTGALTSAGVTLPGLVAPLTISAYGDLIGVCDGGASQQFKLFRVSTQELLYTSPIAGGYVNNPNVSPQRFCFSDPAGSTDAPGLSLLADGSYWIVETTLCRAQHFSASHALIEQVAYIDHAYQLAADQNNPSRLIVKGLEYAIDYSKPWPDAAKLVKFWRPSFPKEFFKLSNPKQSIELSPIGTLATLSNTRLYAWTRERERDLFREQELGTTGTRLTGATESAPVSLGADGSLNYAGFINSGKDYETRARYLTGFDANGNPQRAAATRVHIARNIGDQAPVDYSGYPSPNAFVRTASGKLVFFRGGLMRVLGGKVYGDGPHLGIAQPGVEGFTALTSYATSGAAYRGPYPTDGSYDVGNHANYKAGAQIGYAGEQVRADGELIYTNDPGEFWGPLGKQINKHKLHHSSGLALLVWGPTYADADASPTGYFPGMAGGVGMGELVMDPTNSNRAFVYHSEENGFCGIHRWAVEGLSTIKLATVGTVRSAAATQYTRRLASDTTDLLAAVPSRSNFQAGVAGFTQTPLTEDLSAEFGGSYWGVRTSIKKYGRFDTPDVFIRFRQSKKTNTFAFPGCLSGATSTGWQLRETLNFDEHSFNDGELADDTSGGLYHDLLDQSGKVLVRFYLKANYAASPSQATIYANEKVLATGLLSVLGDAAALNKDLLHAYDNGTATVQYGAYPAVTLSAPFAAGGDFSAPGRVLVTCWHKGAEGVNRDRCVDISRLWFSSKPTPVSGPTFAPADASIGRVDLGAMQQTVSITSAAALKTALLANYSNTILMMADGDFATEGFEQKGTWSNVLLTSSGNTRFLATTSSTCILMQGGATRKNIAYRNIKFESIYAGGGNPLLWHNELPLIDGYEVSGCSFRSPNGSANGLGCVQYSTSSKQGQVAKNILIENNTFQDIGRCGIELLSQGYDGVFRLFNLTIRKNTFANLGIQNEYGMAVSLSGLFRQIDVSDNNATGTRRIGYEFVNTQQAIARNNNLSNGKDGVGYGFSDDDKGFTSDVWVYGGAIDAPERPFYIYECNAIHLDGQGKLWKGGRGADMGTISGCTFDNLNLLIQSTAKEASWQWGSGCVGNTATNCTISSAGSAAAGRLPAYEQLVLRSGATGNKLINCTTILGKQANGQTFAPSPETGADGRIVDQGTNNTITNNKKSVVA